MKPGKKLFTITNPQGKADKTGIAKKAQSTLARTSTKSPKKAQAPNRTAAHSSTKAKPPSRPKSQEYSKTRRGHLTPSQEAAKVRGLAAINRVRKGQSKTLSEAARAESTTVKEIRKLLPGALAKQRPGGRIRVKAGDTYSARVEILTATGPLVVRAHGSRERDLAGLHRLVAVRVLSGKEPASALRQFRGKKVGGHKLISDFNQLRGLALAGVLGQLDTLYASPEISS